MKILTLPSSFWKLALHIAIGMLGAALLFGANAANVAVGGLDPALAAFVGYVIAEGLRVALLELRSLDPLAVS